MSSIECFGNGIDSLNIAGASPEIGSAKEMSGDSEDSRPSEGRFVINLSIGLGGRAKIFRVSH